MPDDPAEPALEQMRANMEEAAQTSADADNRAYECYIVYLRAKKIYEDALKRKDEGCRK
jgi:hypothetical protein